MTEPQIQEILRQEFRRRGLLNPFHPMTENKLLRDALQQAARRIATIAVEESERANAEWR